MPEESESLTLHLLREIRAGQVAMQADIDKLKNDAGELKADMREVKLAVAPLEVRTGRMAERLEKIEKHLGLIPA